MKLRNGFVSNSSSSSFIIRNKTNTEKTLVDFVIENKKLVDSYNYFYDSDELLSEVVAGAENINKTFAPKESAVMIFGDEDGTSIGRVYDYILRDGGESDSFDWELKEYLR